MFTLAGYRKTSGSSEPVVYLLSSQSHFAPQLVGDFPCLAGVPNYAIYLSHRYYDPTISSERARALTAYLISETASQDPKVGGAIRMAEVTPGAFKRLSEQEVEKIVQDNGKLNDQLRAFFKKGGDQNEEKH